jgi:hypothetical protein
MQFSRLTKKVEENFLETVLEQSGNNLWYSSLIRWTWILETMNVS